MHKTSCAKLRYKRTGKISSVLYKYARPDYKAKQHYNTTAKLSTATTHLLLSRGVLLRRGVGMMRRALMLNSR